MTPALQKKVFAALLFGLRKDGYLFLGSSENPLPILQKLEVVHKKFKLFKNLETKRTVSFNAFSLPAPPDTKHANVAFRKEDLQDAGTALTEAVNESLITGLDYLVVCINEKNDVVKSYGNTAKYLLQKNFQANITNLLQEPLAIAFNTLRKSASQSLKKVSVSGVKIKQGKAYIRVTVSVSPLPINRGEKALWMVTFCEDKAAALPIHDGGVFDEKTYVDQYTINLQEEVTELKEKLHSTYEMLDASNENMQSFNEELLSANEEMQSTNEEMQSVNEELHTINTDYQIKNKELQEVNDDLNNYFRSNVNGQLFVNRDLLLMKFSPGTVKHINLLETDIGRPLSNLSTNIKLETFEADIKEVINNGGVLTKEVEANNGKWYQVMTMPYIREVDSKIDGAVITFNDITELKGTQWQLDKSNKNLQRINAELDTFVLAAAHDLLGPLSNIESTISLLNNKDSAENEVDEYLKMINVSVIKFRSLIKELSTIGKIEKDVSTKPVDVRKLLEDIEQSISDKIAASKTTLQCDLQETHISFSKKNLRSILYNLITNAIKYKSDLRNPHIQITTRLYSGFVMLSVTDNGTGIPKKDVDKIFGVYRRLQTNVEGQGIGLYLIKKIVESTGGKIAVESELGIGSTFIVYLKTERIT